MQKATMSSTDDPLVSAAEVPAVEGRQPKKTKETRGRKRKRRDEPPEDAFLKVDTRAVEIAAARNAANVAPTRRHTTTSIAAADLWHGVEPATEAEVDAYISHHMKPFVMIEHPLQTPAHRKGRSAVPKSDNICIPSYSSVVALPANVAVHIDARGHLYMCLAEIFVKPEFEVDGDGNVTWTTSGEVRLSGNIVKVLRGEASCQTKKATTRHLQIGRAHV